MLASSVRGTTLILGLLVSAAALGQTSVVLQQADGGYSGNTDARIVSAHATTNYGSNIVIPLKEETANSLLIRFAIFTAQQGPVPDNATITSATLSLYKFWGAAATFKASRLKRSWSESEATWEIAASGTPWQTAGALGADDVESTPDGQGSVGDAAVDNCMDQSKPAACWLHIDVTSGVQAFRNGSAQNHGWKLAYVTGGVSNDDKEFDSSENSNFPAVRPKLTVTYTTPLPPDPDSCSRDDLDLCARFETAETEFLPGSEVSTQGVGGTLTYWFVQNADNDNAQDLTRIGLVDGNRDGGGSKAIRFATQHNDPNHGSGSRERSEVALSLGHTEASDNREQWWAHSVYFPPEFQVSITNHHTSVFFQFHKDGAAPDSYNQPNFMLQVFNEPLQPGTPDYSRPVIHARSHGGDATTNQYEYQATGQTLNGRCLDTLDRGVWYDFVHHILWRSDGTGFHEIWMRRHGEATVRKVLDEPNISTLFRRVDNSSSWGAYLKVGTYHNFVAGESAVIHDRLRRGSTYAAVKPTSFPDAGELPGNLTSCPNP